MVAAPPAPSRPSPPASSPARAGEGGAVPPPASRPAASAALALVTLVSTTPLFRVFRGDRWLGPVVLTVAAVHLTAWGLRRRGTAPVRAVPAVLAAGVLVVVWTVLGHTTFLGVPTPSTWHHAVSAVHDLGNQFASMVPPVSVTPAFQLLAAAAGGVTAALADWIALGRRQPVVGLAPALAAFVVGSAMGRGHGRGVTVGGLVAAMAVFLLVEAVSSPSGQVWFAGARDGTVRWRLLVGGAIAVTAVVGAVAISPALAGSDGTGALGWRSGLGDHGGERVVPNPLVDLRARLTTYRSTPVFTVASSVPSYWRLTSLDTFDGVTWTSTGSYGTFESRLPGASPPGIAARTAEATFHIQQLGSVWLPAQFDPISVRGVRHVTYDPASDSLLAATATTAGLSYSVTSYQFLAALNAADLEAAPPLAAAPTVARYLRLPASVPAEVTALARSLTSGRTTEYDKALAIQSYLRGPQFSYSLDPPSDGSGTDAIATFLFRTRTGYCQQFAGAYAVLARAAGLPTRLAVGFTQGRPGGAGTFQVLDGDYHTWPEVYFGSRLGWVPFEPTKGFSVPGSAGYSPTAASPAGPAPVTPTTVPSTVPNHPSAPPPTVAKGRQGTSPTTAPPVAAHHGPGAISAWWLLAPGMVLAWAAANGGSRALRRRLRRRRARRRGPAAVVLDCWAALEEDLRWHGVARQAAETDEEFAQRATLWMRRMGMGSEWSHGGLPAMAALGSRARYAMTVPDGLGEQAGAAAAEIQERLAGVAGRPQRWLRSFAVAPGVRERLQRARPGGAARPAPGQLSSVPPQRRRSRWDRSSTV